jgi:hypothetical protein
MSMVKQIYSINQVALFCAAGFCMSLTAALVYDLRMTDLWF